MMPSVGCSTDCRICCRCEKLASLCVFGLVGITDIGLAELRYLLNSAAFCD